MGRFSIASYRNNPLLNTVIAPQAWKGSPVDHKGRFLNLEFPFIPSIVQLLRWKLQPNPYLKEKKAEKWKPTVIKNSSFVGGSDNVMVWLGHSTFYIQIEGIKILIDPVFGDILTVKRQTEMPLDPRQFVDLDFILLTHDHRDHMDERSLRLLAAQNPNVRFLAGLGSEKIIRNYTHSQKIETAGWYQQFTTGEKMAIITFIPSRHWARRGLFDTNKRLWGGFVIEKSGKRILFAGDSGYDGHFAILKDLFGSFTYSILGIGAYQPSWFMRPLHQSPSEALRAFKELNASFFVPMHYGTFDLSDEPLSLPLKDLKLAANAASLTEKLMILEIGQPLLI